MACTGIKDEPLRPESRSCTLTGTIGLQDSYTAETRALTPMGKKTIAAGEKIAVIYTDESNTKVKTEYEFTPGDIFHYGKKASFTVTLTDPKAGGDLIYIYPASMANDDGSVKYEKLNAQDGKLSTISSNLDLCIYAGKLTADKKLPDTTNLANGFAIFELTANNNAEPDITDTITDITISDGVNSYAVTLASPTTPIYVAMQPLFKDKTISFTAHNGSSETFIRSVTGKVLRAGHIYPVNVRLNREIDLSALSADFEARDDDWLTGTLANNVKISVADGADITLSNTSVNESGTWNSGDYAGITCLGSANITLDGTSTVKGFGGAYPGIYIPSGKTLALKGEGTLTAANNGGTGAGIGAGATAGGHVAISGNCIVNATGGAGGAGIGASSTAAAGNVNISGKVTVTATGGNGAAGIGAGDSRNCGEITISGGTVTATGGSNGSGIGGATGSISGTIRIRTGIVNVTGIKGAGASDGIGRGTAGNGDVYFNDSRLYYSGVWHPNPMKAGTYGNLKLVISTTTNTNDTWTVTP